MRVLVFLTDFQGHHLHFGRLLCEAALHAGHEPVLCGPRAFDASVEFGVHFAGIRGDVHIHRMPLGEVAARRPVRVRSALIRAIWDLRVDHVWAPFADVLAASSLLFGPVSSLCPISGLYLRGGYAYPGSTLRKRVKHALTRRTQIGDCMDRAWHLDPLAHEYLRRAGSRTGLMPEPVEESCWMSRDEARKSLGLPTDRRLMMVLGNLDARKGVVQLLRAHARTHARDVSMVLMGRLDPLIRDEVRSLVEGDATVIVREGVCSAEQFTQGIAAGDWLAVTYPRHIGSSGILVRAAAAERPVLASDWGWVGEATRRYGLGIACDCTSDAGIAEALLQLAEAPSWSASDASRRYQSFNTEGNFRAHWLQSIGFSAPMQLAPDATAPASGSRSGSDASIQKEIV